MAEKLGYVPNQVARALSTGRAGNIALVVPDIANPFFPPLIRAAQARADDAGYAVFLGDSDEQPEREDMLLTKMAAQVEGFILASPRLDEERVRTHAARRPLVLINRDIEGLPRILMDVSTGIASAIEHLASLNHRHIAYVSGPPASWANQQRQQAAIRTAEKLGIHLTVVPAYHPNHEAGRKAAGELARRPVTATVAFDDLVAQGIMAGLADLGWRIPQDMSIIGFDDVLAATTYPPLTTVAAHSADAGRRAVKLLAECLSEGKVQDKRIVIPTELIVRATTDQPARRPHATYAEPRSILRLKAQNKCETDRTPMKLHLYPTKPALGEAAASLGAQAIRDAIAAKGRAHIIVATGASQFEMLDALVRQPGIDWSKVTGFHLDEYIGMSDSHPASFRRYLRERFTSKLPTLGAFHFIEGDAPDLKAEVLRIGDLVKANPIDVTFAGIGENGHLAFNDPPADFDVDDPYIVVELDELCRRQQFGEGWFPTFEDVPQTAISMSIRQIMASELVVLSVPDARKAGAVQKALEGPVSPACPASILQRHPACHVFLDTASAGRLSSGSLREADRDEE